MDLKIGTLCLFHLHHTIVGCVCSTGSGVVHFTAKDCVDNKFFTSFSRASSEFLFILSGKLLAEKLFLFSVGISNDNDDDSVGWCVVL